MVETEKSNKLKSMKGMAMKKGIFTACILVAGTLMLSGAMGVKAVDLNPSADDVVALDKLEVTTDIPIEETTTNQAFDAGGRDQSIRTKSPIPRDL